MKFELEQQVQPVPAQQRLHLLALPHHQLGPPLQQRGVAGKKNEQENSL